MAARQSFLLLVLMAAQLWHLRAQPSFDYPTAKAPTTWTNSATLPHTIQYPDGTTIKALLLRSPPERLGPSFAFGFYCRSATGACTRYLLAVFIVYTNSGAGITNVNIGIPHVVWSANRGRPVGENAVLQLAADGNLLLRDADGSLVWSTSTAAAAASLSITDSGNLLLLNGGGRAVWQSFNHPTDALLPGQRLADGRSLYANTSAYDWREGLYAFTATPNGFNAVKRTTPPVVYHQWWSDSGGARKGANYLVLGNGSLSLVRDTTGLPPVAMTLPAAPSKQYVRMELDGHMRVYQWRMSEGGWRPVADVF